MTDPKNWSSSMREKLIFFHGYMIGTLQIKKPDFINVTQSSEEQILDSIMRMQFDKDGRLQ